MLSLCVLLTTTIACVYTIIIFGFVIAFVVVVFVAVSYVHTKEQMMLSMSRPWHNFQHEKEKEIIKWTQKKKKEI